MSGVEAKSLASTRRLLPSAMGEGPVVGMTIGNMVADLYERAEFLSLDLDHQSLTVAVEFDRVETDTVETVPLYQIRAEMKAMPR